MVRAEGLVFTAGEACYLSDEGRRRVIEAYESFKSESVVHPLLDREVVRETAPVASGHLDGAPSPGRPSCLSALHHGLLNMDVLVTYDIETATPEGARRLARVAHVCEGFGTRVQYSVFECRLSDARLQRLIDRLGDIIDPKLDSVNFYRLEGSLTKCRRSIGRLLPREPGDPWVI